MQVLKTQVNPRSAEFRANADAMRKLVEDLHAKASEAEQGGGPAARDRHVSRGRRGQCLPVRARRPGLR